LVAIVGDDKKYRQVSIVVEVGAEDLGLVRPCP